MKSPGLGSLELQLGLQPNFQLYDLISDQAKSSLSARN